jgi:hypothetical protein
MHSKAVYPIDELSNNSTESMMPVSGHRDFTLLAGSLKIIVMADHSRKHIGKINSDYSARRSLFEAEIGKLTHWENVYE